MKKAIEWTRLVFRVHRFELITIAVALSAWVGVAIVCLLQIASVTARYPGCFRLLAPGPGNCDLGAREMFVWERTATILMWLAIPLPFALGIVLGVPVVARELEQRTAQLSWSLAIDRVRWLAMRVWPLGLCALVVLLVVAGFSELLQSAQVAGDDPGLVRHEQRGVLVLARGFAGLGLGVLAGAALGRTLPGILVAAALSAMVVVGINFGMDEWRRSEAHVAKLDILTTGSPYLNGMMLGSVSMLPDGSYTDERNLELLPAGTDFDWWLMIRGDEYWTWVGREIAILTLLTGGIAAIASVRLTQRRPF